MEQSGRNPRQPVANGAGAKTAQTGVGMKPFMEPSGREVSPLAAENGHIPLTELRSRAILLWIAPSIASQRLRAPVLRIAELR